MNTNLHTKLFCHIKKTVFSWITLDKLRSGKHGFYKFSNLAGKLLQNVASFSSVLSNFISWIYVGLFCYTLNMMAGRPHIEMSAV